MRFTELLALVTIIIWPVIPLFWIPVHFGTKFFRRIGRLTYLMPLVTWLPFAYLVYSYKDAVLSFRLTLPLLLKIAGILLLLSGTLLHVWTGKLLGLWGLIGLPEVSTKVGGKLITAGPFSVVRHPTYLAHTLIFLGIFLITEVIAVGVITLLDFIVINLLVIPLEERELLDRFGEEYRAYRNRVPRFFPKIRP